MNNSRTEPKAKITNQVHTTKDYFLFKPIGGNRKKNPLHIKRLKKSMESNYLFTVIIVNDKYEIIDGQHRFEVIKELELPLNYVICKGYGLNEVHVLNQNSKIWKSEDYLHGYCDLGMIDYMIYREFKNKYKFGHNESMAMLTNVTRGGGSAIQKFKDGEFKVSNLSLAEKYANNITKISSIYDGYNRRSFVYAMLTLFKKENFVFSEFIKKLERQKTALTDCVSSDQYISLIEEIYNYHRREKVNLRY